MGISLAVLAMFFFSTAFAFYKACEPELSTMQIIFSQSLCSWLLLLPLVIRREWKIFSSEKLGAISLRTFFGLISTFCIIYALQTVDLAEVVLLNNTAPLFVPIIVWIWHKSSFSPSLILSLLIGFLGIFLILRPEFAQFHAGLFFAALSGLSSALLLVITREIAKQPFLRILFFYFLLFWLFSAPFAIFFWHAPSMLLWLYIFCAALFMVFAQFTFTAALRYAPSHEVAPFIYTGVIFSGLIGWFIWKEKPDWLSILGMAVVCGGGIFSLVFSKRKSG